MISLMRFREGGAVVIHYDSDLKPFVCHPPLDEEMGCEFCERGEPIIYRDENGEERIIKRLPSGDWELSWIEGKDAHH